MSNNNRNWNNPSYQSNQDWDQSRNRMNREDENRYRENESSYGNAGYGNDYNQNQFGNRNYESRGYNEGDRWRGSEGQGGYNSGQGRYERTNYIPDNDENRNYGNRDYENTQYGTSGTYGYRGDYGNEYGSGGYAGMNRRSEMRNAGYGNDYGRRQDWGRARVNTGNYDNGFFDDYGGGRNNEGYAGRTGYAGNQGYGNRGQRYGEMGNERDRGWWDRTRDEVSSWFGDDDAERRRRMDRMSTGGYRGKGPKDYHRSEDRIREDVCDRLTDDDMLDATNIQVEIHGDEVVLTGTVENREQKRRAEDIVESVSGVHDVENRIKVAHRGDMGSRETTTGNVRMTGNETGGNESNRNERNKEKNK